MADNPKKKKVTRTMKVTMDEDEFNELIPFKYNNEDSQ